MRYHRPGKLGRRQHRALDVQVAVDQSGQDKCAVEIDLGGSFVGAGADHVAVVDRDVRRENLIRKEV